METVFPLTRNAIVISAVNDMKYHSIMQIIPSDLLLPFIKFLGEMNTKPRKSYTYIKAKIKTELRTGSIIYIMIAQRLKIS